MSRNYDCFYIPSNFLSKNISYFFSFACLCSEATKKANKNRSGPDVYVGFALHYWGECYGKTQAQIDVLKSGDKKQTHKCTGDQSYTGCRDEHTECVGHNFAEYVYELRQKTRAEISKMFDFYYRSKFVGSLNKFS